MTHIPAFGGDPWPLQEVQLECPSVDEIRPVQTPCCGRATRSGGRLLLHGHGCRSRQAVLPPRPGAQRCRFVLCWVRRYLCTACGRTCSVLPNGVVLRFTYSLASILAAWLDGAAACRGGGGLTDEAVWKRHGLDRLAHESRRSGGRRWRSLRRWAGLIGPWWPGRVVGGKTWRERVATLLLPWVLGGSELPDVVAKAIASHVGRGAAM